MRYSETFVKYTKTLAAPQYEPLSQARERELLKEYMNGSKEAFNTIINAYLRFVIFLLRQYKIPDDVDIMDIVQEGNMGLLYGLSKFNVTVYDCRVSTYCAYWIKFFMGKNLQDALKKREFFTPLEDDDTLLSNSSFITNYSPVDEKYRVRVIEDMSAFCFKDLTNRERLIINLYHGLVHPFVPKTLQEIASMLHTNLERVRQIKNEAKKKIEPPLTTYLNN